MVGAAVASYGCECIDACLSIRQASDPICLYVEFPTLDGRSRSHESYVLLSTASCVERAHAKQMPPEINAVFQQLLAGVLPELNAYAMQLS